MKKYDFNKIDQLIQPLMAMMQEEFPNNCKLIIEPYFARIVYEHDQMIFQSDERKKTIENFQVSDDLKNLINKKISDAVSGIAEKEDNIQKGDKMQKIEKNIETVGELIEILKQYPKDCELEIFALYDSSYYAGGYIDCIEKDGESVFLYCNKD